MARVINGDELKIRLCKMLGLNPDLTQRLIVDINSKIEPLTIYVQMVGTSDLLDFTWEELIGDADVHLSGREPRVKKS